LQDDLGQEVIEHLLHFGPNSSHCQPDEKPECGLFDGMPESTASHRTSASAACVYNNQVSPTAMFAR
jgi:hypothetical protein